MDEHRLILLTGRSGVGKTSLLRAGLVPELRSSGYRVAVCRDWSGSAEAADSLRFLARAVHQDLTTQGISGLADGADVLWQLDDRFGERAVLVLDQFEELIRDARAFKQDLIEVLVDVNQRTSIKVVVSFRSEYLHALRELERQAKPYSIASYYLEDVDPESASGVVLSANTDGRTAIEPVAAASVVETWKAAMKGPEGVGEVGLLHLQALLYVLHDLAGPERPVTERTVAELWTRSGESVDNPPAHLLAEALRSAVRIKLDRCRAVAESIGLDPYLVNGTADLLARSVRHLSSAGYKLIRDAWDLADATFGEEIEDLSVGLANCRATEATSADGPATKGQLDALFDTLINPVLTVGTTDLLATGWDSIAAAADRSAGPATGIGWIDRLHPGCVGHAVDPGAVTSGPMLGLAPAAVLIEELRRYAFMLEWLQASFIVRISRPKSGGATVALVHDGFATALERWAGPVIRSPEGAVHAITAPRGASYSWATGPVPLPHVGTQILPSFDGRRGEGADGSPDGMALHGPALVNLRWRGTWVHAAFRQLAFVNCDLRGTYFHQCLFEGVTFVNCLLDGSIVSECTVVGSPSAPRRGYSYTAPQFHIPIGQDRLRDLARYRGGGTEATVLLSEGAGRPAVPSADPAKSRQLGFERGGLTIYGGRLSSFVVRACTFEAGGTFSLREVAGSGLDVVEVGGSGAYEIVGSLLRHGTFTSAADQAMARSAELAVTVLDSAVAQMWIGDDIRGTLDVDNSTLVHVWNGSSHMAARATNSRFHGLANVATDPATCTPFLPEEGPRDLSSVDPTGTIAGLSANMDYRLDPSSIRSVR